VVDFPVVDFLDPIGAERLHAGGAGHGSGGDNFGFAAFEEGAEVDLRVEHEFLTALAIGPEILGSIEAGGEAVVGGGDHAVVVVKCRRTHFSIRILGTEAGDMGKSHGVLGNAETVLGHGGRLNFKFQISKSKEEGRHKTGSRLNRAILVIMGFGWILNRREDSDHSFQR
jgi:hypothetical protein